MVEPVSVLRKDVASGQGFLAGGGELGRLIRAFAWSDTPLGPAECWPQNLKMALRIMLTSRQPIWVGWGPELTYFYNDPYKSIIGGKHPWALGQPTFEVWREIWTDISPMLDTALSGDRGTYVEAQLLIMERNGYPEETYYTFSYSPIPNDDGTVGGIICFNTDDTQRVIGERQLALLRDLAAETAHARSWEEACTRSAQALTKNARDLPFAMIYMDDPDAAEIKLAASAVIDGGHPMAPELASDDEVLPIAAVLRTQSAVVVELDGAVRAELPSGPWTAPPTRAALFPILPTGETGRAGVLVVGLNPFRLFDQNYRSFLSLVAGQIASAIANAQAYEEERRRAEALAEIDRAKTAFFSNVSHEFRTPLTLMLAPIEDALNSDEPRLDPVHRERLETAHRNSTRLLRLVNSLLDFSRIESGRVDACFEPTDLSRLVAELASNFESVIKKAGLGLRIDCPPLPEKVHVDREMWEKIILNLLSNAFKFTFEGEIAVKTGVTADGRAAEIIVRDTGVGIPEDELPRLFERFHRVEGQKGRSFEGSGIGLALVQELVQLHGGSIRAESAVGAGTSFIITVPFGIAHLPAERIGARRTLTATSLRADAFIEEARRWLPDIKAGDEELPAGHADETADDLPLARGSEDAHILVVDDNADMRAYVRRLLAGRWEVETAGDGNEALAAIRAKKPDLVLTDVMMPGLDGFGLLRELRKDPELRDLPVIVLSARAGEESRVEGLDAGADDYLTKPFSARELVARVNVNLEILRVRREATRDLRESEARFRNMADNAPVMMWMTEPSGELVYLNRLWIEFTGQTQQQAQGFGAWQALHPDDQARAEEAFLRANSAHMAFGIEYRLRRADGTYRWALSAASPRFGDDGEFLGYIGSVIDITERKEAENILKDANAALEQRVAATIAERLETEAQLLQAQKMEAVGKLTGGVAHDFNNVLQVIGGNLQLLVKDVAGNLRAENRLQTAIAAISRGSRLASQLLAFARRQPLSPKVINLGRLIRSIDDLLRRALGEEIEIETVIAGGLWNAFLDATQVENALINLAINARDAMQGHGKLTIEAGNAFLDDAYAARHVDVPPGQYVMVAVSDTGCGIAPDIIDKVFEPFFTTKKEGQGTGLGLSMVYGFVKQSGGHVKLYSEPGHGTTVRLYLPRAKEEEDIETDTDIGPATGGSETVLAVEDDEDVRSTVVDMLSELGYRVLKAKDAQSALAIIESGVPIDLLFTDVVMPGPLRSPDLARKARERLPNIAVLFTSGYTENAIVHDGRLDEGIDLLSKPYTREALARKIRHVLQDKQPCPAAARSNEPVKAKALRILLVEDDAFIRLATAGMLADLGHTVSEAGEAKGALELLQARPFDVLVTDVSLPKMRGDALALEAIKLRPELRVVFATGYEMTPNELRHGVILRKPFDEDALVAALAEATGQGR